MHNENPEIEIWATDYSAQAVEVVKVGQAGRGKVVWRMAEV
jgi:hypothetical protein